ncbi:MAG: hypothetical protein WA133_06130 [Syntrophales bacterium]
MSDSYKISDWYGDVTIPKNLKDFFLGFRKFPYEAGDETAEDRFIQATYRLNEPEETNYNGAITEGLAWAYIRETLCISFPVNSVWRKTNICLREEKGQENSLVLAFHASQLEHIEFHQAWIDSLKEIVLIETDTLPSQKKVNLRDDHGKDALTAFAQKLLQSPYLKGVINSLPFNPKEGNFIRSAYSDGRIELVLIWTDEGFGMVVQSTGRNLRETEAMAQILKDQYS